MDDHVFFFYTVFQDKSGNQLNKNFADAVLMKDDLLHSDYSQLLLNQVTQMFKFYNDSIIFIAVVLNNKKMLCLTSY